MTMQPRRRAGAASLPPNAKSRMFSEQPPGAEALEQQPERHARAEMRRSEEGAEAPPGDDRQPDDQRHQGPARPTPWPPARARSRIARDGCPRRARSLVLARRLATAPSCRSVASASHRNPSVVITPRSGGERRSRAARLRSATGAPRSACHHVQDGEEPRSRPRRSGTFAETSSSLLDGGSRDRPRARTAAACSASRRRSRPRRRPGRSTPSRSAELSPIHTPPAAPTPYRSSTWTTASVAMENSTAPAATTTAHNPTARTRSRRPVARASPVELSVEDVIFRLRSTAALSSRRWRHLLRPTPTRASGSRPGAIARSY